MTQHKDVNATDGPSEGTYALPASLGQQQLWIFDRLEPGSPVYTCCRAYRLDGPLDVDRLRHALDRVIERHEVLRTTFEERNGELVQIIGAAEPLAIDQTDLASDADPAAELDRRLVREARRPFDLRRGPLFRAALFRLSAQQHVLLLTIHHIVFDGWSEIVLIRELESGYRSAAASAASDLPDLEIQYADFAVWQKETLAAADAAPLADYWHDRLAGLTPIELPLDRPRPKAPTYRGALSRFSIPGSTRDRLRAIGASLRATPFMTFGAVFMTLLQRQTGREDVGIGTPTAGRHHPGVEHLIGFFVHTLVLRVDLAGDPTFRELIVRTRDAALGLYAHQDLPFQLLVDGGRLETALTRAPFQVTFAMQPSVESAELGPVAMTPVVIDPGVSKFDLTLSLHDRHDRVEAIIEYNTDLFDATTIAGFGRQFQALMAGVAENPDRRLSQLPLVDDAERHRLLVEWNDTATPFDAQDTIASVFAARVAAAPDAPALTARGARWTYRDLNARADAIAASLAAAGVIPGHIVAVCLPRSGTLVAALLAVLKAGAAYLPLDPVYPPERLALMIADASPVAIIADRTTARAFDGAGARLLLVDDLSAPAGTPVIAATSDDAAYLIYTSGSTGTPKGVVVEHRHAMSFFAGMDRVLGREPGTWLAVASVSFDATILELWWSLTRGFHVVLWGGLTEGGPSVPELITREGVTHALFVPSFARTLLSMPGGAQALARFRTLILGAEEVTRSLVDALGRVPTRRLINMYGPTEATVVATAGEIEDGTDRVSIGRPTANTRVYLLDAAMEPVPVGMAGEMYVGGAGIARGYLNRDALTRERFVPDPFSDGTGRLYRTGDLARFLPDGRIEFLGRNDTQVKLRGLRLELGEIESALERHPSVRQAVVVARQERLVAYVAAAGPGVDAEVLRTHLRQTLPEYMVPSAFVALDAFPLSPNGKIDRAQLPDPPARAPRTVLAPRTPLEQRVAAAFAEMLRTDPIGVDDDFFELGGTSLLAIRVISRLNAEFRIDLPLSALLSATTVAQLSVQVRTAAGIVDTPDAGGDVSVAASETERRLQQIWARVLGHGPVSMSDHWTALQGDRDLLAAMLSDVRASFGLLTIGLPVQEFLATPTIRNLASLIDGATAGSASLIVPLQPAGSKRPLFLVHAGDGYVFTYRALATRLAPDRPLYAIRAETRADRRGRPFDKTRDAESLARRYVAELRKAQPTGPYSLGGACFGGVVAFEMARQLRALGEDVVGPVLLFDSYVGVSFQPGASDYGAHSGQEYALLRANVHLRAASDLGPFGRVAYLARKVIRNLPTLAPLAVASVRAAWNRAASSAAADEIRWAMARRRGTPVPLEEIHLKIMDRFRQTTARLLEAYTPRAYDGQLALFRATQGLDPAPGWTGLTAAPPQVHLMPGEHLDMMEEPAVADVAAIVREHLERAEAERGRASRPTGEFGPPPRPMEQAS